MAFSRAAALRSCFRAARAGRPTVARPQLFRQVARRSYASGGDGHAKAGGDTIWAIGAVAVTIPTCWYLLSNAPGDSHGHDDHGAAHGEEGHHEEPKEAEGSEEPAEKTEESDKDEESGSEDEGKETPDTSDDESEKDDTKEDTKDDKKDEKASKSKDEKPTSKDKPAANKSSGGNSTTSGKQEGVSNADTKHPENPKDNPDKSTKAEGDAETAKVKGTVEPKRPGK